MSDTKPDWWESTQGTMIHDPSYLVGYSEGESSVMADVDVAFSEVLDMDVEGPMDAAVKCEAALAAKEARIAELEEALRPFVEALQVPDSEPNDGCYSVDYSNDKSTVSITDFGLTVADFRRARAVLEKATPAG